MHHKVVTVTHKISSYQVSTPFIMKWRVNFLSLQKLKTCSSHWLSL
jgi:hypothetical protein